MAWTRSGFASRAQERAATPSTMPSRDGEDRQKCYGQESRERQTSLMTKSEPKADLLLYLQSARDALLWKLDGLSEYDIRRPLTPTGTNLLGLVKHVTGVELGYLGATFERSSGEPMPWLDDDAEPIRTIGRPPTSLASRSSSVTAARGRTRTRPSTRFH
jgi:hypothetical protein